MVEIKPQVEIFVGQGGMNYEHAVTLKTGVGIEGEGVVCAYIEPALAPLLLALLAQKVEGAEVTINGQKVDLSI